MAKIEKFEDIIIWQKARILNSFLFDTFKNQKDYNFRSQILSASLSIMNNIAEGFERGGRTEFKRFLIISKGSCGEVRSMLHIALDHKMINDSLFKDLYYKCEEISKMTAGFIKKL